jgi:hypothetical protein
VTLTHYLSLNLIARQFFGENEQHLFLYMSFSAIFLLLKVQTREQQTCYLPVWQQAHSARFCMKGICRLAFRISDQTFFESIFYIIKFLKIIN